MSQRSRSERGQLVLIGAISIAFILLGVVVVFNGVQYTETINSGSATDDLEDARVVKSEIETGLEGMNLDDDDGDEVEEYIHTIYHPAKARQSPVHVTAEASGGTATVTYTTPDTTVTFEVDY